MAHHKSVWANPLIEEDSHYEQLEWSAPEVVEEYDCLVKPGQHQTSNSSKAKSQKKGYSGLLHSPVDIIGEKVDHLTNSGLPKRAVGELESLSADKMAVGCIKGV